MLMFSLAKCMERRIRLMIKCLKMHKKGKINNGYKEQDRKGNL